MHILQIYKDYFPVLGGIENYLRVLAEGMAERGHRVTVLVTSTERRAELLRQNNLTIYKTGRMLRLASTPLSPAMFRRAAMLHDVDLVHLQFPYPPADLAALAVPGRPPLLLTYHSDIVRQRHLLRLYRPLLRRTLARAGRIIATSPQYIAGSAFLRPHRDRCTVVPLSTDVERFAQPDPLQVAQFRARYPGPLLLFVGRLRYYKGLHFLLQALPLLQTGARLLIAGTGPEEPQLRDLAGQLGINDRVAFLGDVADTELPVVYAAADVFVLPSHLRAEAFGIVQVEAQAAGLPVVCCELGTGTSYVTQHGRTGFVVPPADPPALARAIEVLLVNPGLTRQLGTGGRARARAEFSHQRMLERTEQIYREVLACLRN
jgi:glycosyltransferase involved in cell wall biosynthesis